MLTFNKHKPARHYAVIIDQIQAQLNLALDLNDDLDQEWIDDVKARNCEHASSMKAFEERCRSLYESRLTAYIESADHRLSECEERLLVSGARAARNSNSMEAKISRLRLACSKWRVDYQSECSPVTHCAYIIIIYWIRRGTAALLRHNSGT